MKRKEKYLKETEQSLEKKQDEALSLKIKIGEYEDTEGRIREAEESIEKKNIQIADLEGKVRYGMMETTIRLEVTKQLVKEREQKIAGLQEHIEKMEENEKRYLDMTTQLEEKEKELCELQNKTKIGKQTDSNENNMVMISIEELEELKANKVLDEQMDEMSQNIKKRK